jgi:hypothetical protein
VTTQRNSVAQLLGASVGEANAAWLSEALDRVAREAPTTAAFTTAWNANGRRLGAGPLTLAAAEASALPFPAAGFAADECGRGLLLLAMLAGQPADAHVNLVTDLYATGELREQQAVIRVLPYLPAPERFVAIGIEAVRNNATTVIEAIACDTPYPARFFPDAAFGQLVLKCLFVGLSLRRLDGLARRITPELRRMVAGYVAERRAAGRTVPDDTALILEGDAHAPV